MSVERLDNVAYDMVPKGEGDYVRYEDFAAVLLALRTVYKTCIVFAGRDLSDTPANSIRNYLKPIVDQYE